MSLDPAVEAVLAWAVREGATNVIRHSGARHCTFRISASLTDAGVEVIDDGRGSTINGNGAGAGEAGGAGLPGGAVAHNGAGNGRGARPRGGHGIAGLAERAALLNGWIEAGSFGGGGYRLAVTVPVSRA